MSDENESVFGSAPDGQTGTGGTVDTAKSEAGEVAHTTADAAKDVAYTAKDEATAVIDETRASVADLYHEAKRELSDQAAAQQMRLSSGLHATASDLDAMTTHASSTGIAGDVVSRVARQLDDASAWLAARGPEGVVAEVKSFARRRPGVFIFGALVAGVVAGRLTRALASSASSSASGDSTATTPSATGRAAYPAATVGTDAAGAMPPRQPATGAADSYRDAPLYAQTAAGRPDNSVEEDRDERSDTF